VSFSYENEEYFVRFSRQSEIKNFIKKWRRGCNMGEEGNLIKYT
jgi:hypothetical protein